MGSPIYPNYYCIYVWIKAAVGKFLYCEKLYFQSLWNCVGRDGIFRIGARDRTGIEQVLIMLR